MCFNGWCGGGEYVAINRFWMIAPSAAIRVGSRAVKPTRLVGPVAQEVTQYNIGINTKRRAIVILCHPVKLHSKTTNSRLSIVKNTTKHKQANVQLLAYPSCDGDICVRF